MLFIKVPAVGIRWLPAAAAALMWSLVSGSAAMWYLHWPRSGGGMDAAAVVPERPEALAGEDQGSVARALGHAGEAPAAADERRRFQLLGVIAAPAGRGSALLAVDGQPARAFVQGQAVVEGWHLLLVSRSGVRLLADASGAVLELPLPGMDSRSSRE